MKRHRNPRDLRAFCGEVHADDGVDPREAFSRDGARDHRTEQSRRKDLQLARQAFRAIDAAFRGELADPILQELNVVAVTPAPDAGHLLVILESTSPLEQAARGVVIERLDRVRRVLRQEVAAAITRKRAPELSFQVVERPGRRP